MLNLRDIEESILATGKLDGRELEMLRQQLYADGKIDRRKADFLVELHKRGSHTCHKSIQRVLHPAWPNYPTNRP